LVDLPITPGKKTTKIRKKLKKQGVFWVFLMALYIVDINKVGVDFTINRGQRG
jgi:hypothetical protein